MNDITDNEIKALTNGLVRLIEDQLGEDGPTVEELFRLHDHAVLVADFWLTLLEVADQLTGEGVESAGSKMTSEEEEAFREAVGDYLIVLEAADAGAFGTPAELLDFEALSRAGRMWRDSDNRTLARLIPAFTAAATIKALGFDASLDLAGFSGCAWDVVDLDAQHCGDF